MDALERIAYAIARGFARAWFEIQMAARQAEREVPDEETLRIRDRFRAAVERVRAQENHPPEPGHTT